MYVHPLYSATQEIEENSDYPEKSMQVYAYKKIALSKAVKIKAL